MITLSNLSLFLAALLSAIAAGLFYSYACSVNPGLGKLGDLEYVKAMQSINREILNAWFFTSFMGTLLLLPLAAWFNYTSPAGPVFYLLIAAAIIYILGVFGVTMLGNVPLNNALEAFDTNAATAAQISGQRGQFEAAWNRYHLIRTCASVLSFALVLLAVFKKS